jgi:hypothetical protein
MNLKPILLACTVVSRLPSASQADTVILDAAADATIYQNNVNNASGAGNGLYAGVNTSGAPRRGLLAFNIADAIPAGSTIEAADLTLVLGDVSGANAVPKVDIELHRLLAAWGEGLSQQQTPPNDSLSGIGQGAAALDGDVTWNARFFSASTPTLWSHPGGDFDPTPSITMTVDKALDSYTFPSTPGLVADVQSWLDAPAANYGWLLKGASESLPATLRGFYTRNAATPTLHPKLSVTFQPPTATADFNDDGHVDAADLEQWQTAFGSTDAADANGDQLIDGADFLLWQREQSPGAATPVPEPPVQLFAICCSLPWVIGRRKHNRSH